MDLMSELRNLEQKETFLDLQKFWIEESIKNTTENCSKYPSSNNAESRIWCLLKSISVCRVGSEGFQTLSIVCAIFI